MLKWGWAQSSGCAGPGAYPRGTSRQQSSTLLMWRAQKQPLLQWWLITLLRLAQRKQRFAGGGLASVPLLRPPLWPAFALEQVCPTAVHRGYCSPAAEEQMLVTHMDQWISKGGKNLCKYFITFHNSIKSNESMQPTLLSSCCPPGSHSCLHFPREQYLRYPDHLALLREMHLFNHILLGSMRESLGELRWLLLCRQAD